MNCLESKQQKLYPSPNGGINATFEIAIFSGWTVCEETKKVHYPKRPKMSLQELFDSMPDPSTDSQSTSSEKKES